MHRGKDEQINSRLTGWTIFPGRKEGRKDRGKDEQMNRWIEEWKDE